MIRSYINEPPVSIREQNIANEAERRARRNEMLMQMTNRVGWRPIESASHVVHVRIQLSHLLQSDLVHSFNYI